MYSFHMSLSAKFLMSKIRPAVSGGDKKMLSSSAVTWLLEFGMLFEKASVFTADGSGAAMPPKTATLHVNVPIDDVCMRILF